MYTYRSGHKSQANTQSTQMYTNSTNDLILLPSLTKQDGVPMVQKYGYAYVQGGSIQQLGSDTQSAQ